MVFPKETSFKNQKEGLKEVQNFWKCKIITALFLDQPNYSNKQTHSYEKLILLLYTPTPPYAFMV
jgi:hypothetical protein